MMMTKCSGYNCVPENWHVVVKSLVECGILPNQIFFGKICIANVRFCVNANDDGGEDVGDGDEDSGEEGDGDVGDGEGDIDANLASG